MPKRNACAARVAAMTDDEFTELAAAVDERRCRDEYEFGTYAEAPHSTDRTPRARAAARQSRPGTAGASRGCRGTGAGAAVRGSTRSREPCSSTAGKSLRPGSASSAS